MGMITFDGARFVRNVLSKTRETVEVQPIHETLTGWIERVEAAETRAADVRLEVRLIIRETPGKG